MYWISCIMFVFTLCVLFFVLWKIYKINEMKKSAGKIIATYPRVKRRWIASLGPVYFIGQCMYIYAQYVNGDIDTAQQFLIQSGSYVVASCFMTLIAIHLIKSVEIYEKGVVDGLNFYSYEELKGYKTSTWENPKENIFLYRGREKMNDNVNLLIRQEDMNELESILQRYIPKLMMK
ncbi:MULTISPECIES: iron ABC transporter substrate-binding protein [Bacillus]|uniref:Iron ABC transporter substrate-binding protein n=2 Tax=Bacillus cereus group TaxID=86661 RepID=A0A2A7D5W5_BACAN|nr:MULTISPECIES: iron ABC transporter substrate-binding protein [Bacillus]MCP1166071.1 iron ABC transporter substrate-binding protein [Bacillus sp. 1813sda1]MDC7974760.1 iron ABC transporter substrate-binding protein [Bacillus sp. BLCC-B18]OTW69209.1 iron ABC transporter substrate-binding protein [Bacillus thuringiensis serovar coreanensis]OTX45408.1 iron ABC transporter substrate-binding protein [Bacillus thuringiensis serovar sooncheon]OTX48981.1 iron ABC transporter substrate-binding protei